MNIVSAFGMEEHTMNKFLKGLLKVLLVIFIVWNVITRIWGGYNGIMYKHLSNPDNYEELQVEYCGRYNGESYTYFRIGSDSPDMFPIEYDIESTDIYEVKVEIIEANNNILKKNGFYDDIKKGDLINIRVSWFYYGDGPFYFITEVKANEKEYLSIDDGIRNMKKMMIQHWTLL